MSLLAVLTRAATWPLRRPLAWLGETWAAIDTREASRWATYGEKEDDL